MPNIRKMSLHYKNKDLLKNHPFYSAEIKSSKKKTKNLVILSFLSELPFFNKKPKELSIKKLLEELSFFPRKIKKINR